MSKSDIPAKGDFVSIEYTPGDVLDPTNRTVVKGGVSKTFSESYSGAPDTSYMIEIVDERPILFEGWISDDGTDVSTGTTGSSPYDLTVTVKANDGSRVANTTVTLVPDDDSRSNITGTTDSNGQVVLQPGVGTYTISASESSIIDEKTITIEDSNVWITIQNRYKDTNLKQKDPYGKDIYLGTGATWERFG